MDKDFNKADWEFFVVALKEEARDVLWSVQLDVDPDTLIKSALEDLQSLAPRPEATETRSRDEIWKQVRERLLTAAYALRPHCIRCGTCCEKGSPTLLRQDNELFITGVLTPSDVFTIRSGEQVYLPETERTVPSENEFIKIRESHDTHACIFLEASDKSCQIYGSRPEQCRRQECWNPKEAISQSDGFLTREDLLRGTGDLWLIIQKHEQRCSPNDFTREVARLSATKGQTVDDLLGILAFDHHVRDFVSKNLSIDESFLDFFFGRPLSQNLKYYGLRLDQGDDGTYVLTTDGQDAVR